MIWRKMCWRERERELRREKETSGGKEMMESWLLQKRRTREKGGFKNGSHWLIQHYYTIPIPNLPFANQPLSSLDKCLLINSLFTPQFGPTPLFLFFILFISLYIYSFLFSNYHFTPNPNIYLLLFHTQMRFTN